MIVFDGYQEAKKIASQLATKLHQLGNLHPTVAAIFFFSDQDGQTYTQLKQRLAQQLGIVYQSKQFYFSQVKEIRDYLRQLNADKNVNGIIIQKPRRRVWQQESGGERRDFDNWWRKLVETIAEEKDVDGLHPSTVELIAGGQLEVRRRVMPATMRAVLTIVERIPLNLATGKIVILGRSDLLGKPLAAYWRRQGLAVELWGRKEWRRFLATKQGLRKFDLIVSSTGQANLINGEMVKKGVAIIDVGEPRGDVDFASVKDKVSFITPVPGGVGPMTVVSLLANAVDLWRWQQ